MTNEAGSLVLYREGTVRSRSVIVFNDLQR